jgi:tetratricopeptide (TPR) repeat protein
VRKVGNRVRVTTQLADAATSGHIWAERYDRDLADIFAVQDEIAASVSAAVLPALERSERERVARKRPDNLDAWESYQRGLWHVSKVEAAENALAMRFFERAIELDPSFAAAHAAMSFALRAQAIIFRPQAERQTWLPRAMEHARRAIALDHADAFGHSSLAVALVHAGRHEEALAAAEFALTLDPNSSRAYYCRGFALAFGGRPQEAIGSLMMAMRLSPLDPFTPLFLNVRARILSYGRLSGGGCDRASTVPVLSEFPERVPNSCRRAGADRGGGGGPERHGRSPAAVRRGFPNVDGPATHERP